MAKTTEYFFKEGCFIEEWHNSSADDEMSVARVRVEVDKTTKPHLLRNTKERYVLLDGTAQVTVGSKTWMVEQGDIVEIPPNVVQKIQNVGSSDLVFLAICTPRFEEQNYQEILD